MESPSKKTIPALNAVFVTGVVCVLVYLYPPEKALEKDLAAAYPFESIARIQPTWRTFNEYSLGGMMDFNAKPTFIDSRNDIFEHHGILQEYLDIENLREPFRRLDESRIDHVLIHENTALSFSLEHSQDWRVEMRGGSGDDRYELFARVAGMTASQDPSKVVPEQVRR